MRCKWKVHFFSSWLLSLLRRVYVHIENLESQILVESVLVIWTWLSFNYLHRKLLIDIYNNRTWNYVYSLLMVLDICWLKSFSLSWHCGFLKYQFLEHHNFILSSPNLQFHRPLIPSDLTTLSLPTSIPHFVSLYFMVGEWQSMRLSTVWIYETGTMM